MPIFIRQWIEAIFNDVRKKCTPIMVSGSCTQCRFYVLQAIVDFKYTTVSPHATGTTLQLIYDIARSLARSVAFHTTTCHFISLALRTSRNAQHLAFQASVLCEIGTREFDICHALWSTIKNDADFLSRQFALFHFYLTQDRRKLMETVSMYNRRVSGSLTNTQMPPTVNLYRILIASNNQIPKEFSQLCHCRNTWTNADANMDLILSDTKINLTQTERYEQILLRQYEDIKIIKRQRVIEIASNIDSGDISYVQNGNVTFNIMGVCLSYLAL